eukprot:551414_1
MVSLTFTNNDCRNLTIEPSVLRTFNKFTIVRQGYLSKRSAILNVFRKRWIVLFDQNTLVSYKTKSKKPQEITEIFNLREADNVEISKTKNQFKLLSRTFKADTNEDMLDWIKCLESVIYQNASDQYLLIVKRDKWKIQQTHEYPVDETTMSYISIPILIECKQNVTYQCKFRVNILYNRLQLATTQQLLEDCKIHIARLYPLLICASYHIHAVYSGQKSQKSIDVDQYLSHYTIQHLHEGFIIEVTVPTTTVTGTDNICNYVKKTMNPKQCPIYKKMMNEYYFNDNYLAHLNQFNHFKDEYMEKPECKYNDKCFAYVRLEKGSNRLDDRCHVKLFRHPPRRRRIKLDNTNSFKIHTSFVDNHGIYNPIKDDEKYELQQLISEVIKNGYKQELCMKNEDDIKNNNY